MYPDLTSQRRESFVQDKEHDILEDNKMLSRIGIRDSWWMGSTV